MTDTGKERRSFRREPPNQRRVELIEATLRVLASGGIEAATVRAISAEAGVTPGLIRHHFHSKEDLLHAAYDHHMSEMIRLSDEAAPDPSSTRKLALFIRQTLSPPVTSPQAMQLWAGFMQTVHRDDHMRRIHRTHYEGYRDRLGTLIAAALREQGRVLANHEQTTLAIACNALLDGLWLEGSALPDDLGTEELVDIGLTSISAILNLDTSLQKAST